MLPALLLKLFVPSEIMLVLAKDSFLFASTNLKDAA